MKVNAPALDVLGQLVCGRCGTKFDVHPAYVLAIGSCYFCNGDLDLAASLPESTQ
jgi:hypothetical protein